MNIAETAWKILEYKYWYYVESSPIISDYEYDQFEKAYEAACKAAGEPPTACDMIDFDMSRRCCQMVAAKLQGIDYKLFKDGRVSSSEMPIKKKNRKVTKK